MSSEYKRAFWVAVAGLLALCVVASQAKATTTVVGDPGYQSWVDAVQRVPTPEGAITVEIMDSENDCVGTALGCADPRGIIYLSPVLTIENGLRGLFLHELGHIFDMYEMTDADRQAYMSITGHTSWGYVEGTEHNGWADEWFADTYAICAGAKRIDRRWDYSVGNRLLHGRKVQRACAVIRYAGTH
jgi:hypothetical protein